MNKIYDKCIFYYQSLTHWNWTVSVQSPLAHVCPERVNASLLDPENTPSLTFTLSHTLSFLLSFFHTYSIASFSSTIYSTPSQTPSNTQHSNTQLVETYSSTFIRNGRPILILPHHLLALWKARPD